MEFYTYFIEFELRRESVSLQMQKCFLEKYNKKDIHVYRKPVLEVNASKSKSFILIQ
jgi:hypothetical protein